MRARWLFWPMILILGLLAGGAAFAQEPGPEGLVALTPIIGIDPTSLDFGSCTLVGQCADLTIDVFNNVNDPTSILEVTSVVVNGAAFAIQSGQTPPYTIPGDGTRVTYTIRFCPTNAQQATGTFVVSAGNAANSPQTAQLSGTGNAAPLCDAGGPYTGTVNQAVSFDGSGSSDPGGSIASYAWNFGDGGTATGPTPSHTYTATGNYTATLTVTDNCGATSTCEASVTINPPPNEPPVCDAGGPYSGLINQAVTFDGTGSSDPDGTIASYVWSFGDGGTGTGATPSHTYTSAGSFTVSLTVTDDDAASSTCSTQANIGTSNLPPVCDAGGPYTGTVNQSVAFDGTGSSDPDGTIASYAWDFGDGGTGSGATPTHTFTSVGTFTVTLTVTDNDGASSTCTTTAEISETPNQPPVCDAGGPYTGTVNQAVAFDGTGSSDPDGTIASYAWSFGDGGTGSGATPSHTYTSAGTFTVTLTVTDNDGASSTCTTTATIGGGANEPPVCDAGGPYSGTVNQAVTFDGTGSSDPDGTIASYAWDFGDGGTGSGATPSHTFTSAGTFTVALTVTDNEGASSTCTATANIRVAGNQDPNCSLATPSRAELWTPSHGFLVVNILGVTDPDGDPVTITIDGVTQDEPLVGEGSGDYCPDARLQNGRLQLRAERCGSGNGRVYEIAFTATDGRGGSCSGTVTVCVPHDRSPGQGCVDDGQSIDSFGPCPSPKGQTVAPNQANEMDVSDGVQFAAASAGAGQALFGYALPEDGFVSLEVFDVSGRLVATVERGQQSQGVHEVTWDAGGAARGVYYARFQAAGVSLTRSVLILR